MPFEIVVADDGSSYDTASLINEFKLISPVPVIHVWHEDKGYRLASIRNKAFLASSGDYIVQVDGDLILHSFFLYDHWVHLKTGTFVCGGRSLINKGLSNSLLDGVTNIESLTWKMRGVAKKYNSFRCNLLSLFNYYVSSKRKAYLYALGCNMAFWKADLLGINGYNEAFEGWGREDNDLAVRLMNLGVKMKFVKFGAIVFHLHHEEKERSKFDENNSLLSASIEKKLTIINNGIFKL